MVDARVARCLEDVDGAGHVDLRADRRVGLAEGHLQRAQMDHVADAMRLEDGCAPAPCR